MKLAAARAAGASEGIGYLQLALTSLFSRAPEKRQGRRQVQEAHACPS